MRRMLGFAVLALVVLSAGCGGKSASSTPARTDSPAVARVKQMSVDEMWASTRKQYRKLWAYVYPGYRSVTTFAFWESCKHRQAAKPSKIKWLSFKATEAAPLSMQLPKLGRVNVLIVTVYGRLRYKGRISSVPLQLYWTKVKGHWRSLWSPREFAAYKAHRCPA